MDEYDAYTIEAMMKYGGSFVKGLAACMCHADRINMEKIRKTWPEYLKEYGEIGQKMKREGSNIGA
jgi:hypothetical protein